MLKIIKLPFIIFLLLLTFSVSCKKKKKEQPPVPKNISYKTDGRTVKAGDPLPIAVDINADGSVDFTIFVELTANSSGDHLYIGTNPLGSNFIKSSPEDENHFLNMGFAISEFPQNIINETLRTNEWWTDNHTALAIRHTNTNSTVWHEGDWSDGLPHLVGIKHMKDGKIYFGWLRIKFDKSTEIVTLVDYAYEKTEGQFILAGDF